MVICRVYIVDPLLAWMGYVTDEITKEPQTEISEFN